MRVNTEGQAAKDAADMRLKVFFEVHSDLPRQGPGSQAATLRALNMADLKTRYTENSGHWLRPRHANA